ncbi:MULTISPECIES: hypothetical protein [Serratia]|uniref:hypothetical protein n=1 Tax=Serratia TaxID=613 RepID=UPI0015749BF5|nr:hypothetical protein [Serratia marcescens]MBI6134841.1 hypothetical protein [Serratia marcescens]MDN0028033.1 hypothetical protein [Serratia marcescens]NSM47774.1 hypothetical protein [Serratia marcescens]
MSNHIDTIIEDVQSVQKDGTESIDVQKLLEYLQDLKREELQSKEESLERLKATNQAHIEHMKLIASANLESFRSVISTGANASKSCMLVNGGAAIALLAFVGNIWSKDTAAAAVTELAYGVLFFCFGVLCAAVCTGITYLAQYCYSNVDIGNDNDEKSGWKIAGGGFNIVAILSAIASLILFGYGCYSAYEAIILHSVHS